MALYLGKDKIAGHSIDSKMGDTLPIGAIIDYDGTEVPANWELVEDEAGNSTSNIANSIIILNSDLTADKVQKVLSGLEKNSETGEYSIKTAMFWEYPYQNDTDIATFIYIPVIQAMTSIEDNIVGVIFKSPVITGTSYQVIAAIQNPESNPTTFASLEARGIIEYVEDLGLSHNSAALAVSQGKILNDKITALENKIKDSYKVELILYDHWTSEIRSINTYSAYDYETWQDIIDDTDGINSNNDFGMENWVDGNPYVYYQDYAIYYGDNTHVQTTDRLIPGRTYECTVGGGTN